MEEPAHGVSNGREPCGVIATRTDAPNHACRICLAAGGDEGLCTPCPCRGSMRFVHFSCLRSEFLSRGQWTQLTCSVCKNEFAGEVAIRIARLALERAEEEWGACAMGTFIAADHLGRLLSTSGNLQEAEPLLRRALQGLEQVAGADDQEALIAASNLGMLLKLKLRFEEAEPFVHRAWLGSIALNGEDHPETLVFGMNFAALLRELGRAGEAEPLLRRAFEGLAQHRGSQHPDTLAAAGHLGNLLLHLRKDLGEAEPLARRAWEGSVRHFGPEHPRTLMAATDLGVLLLERDRPTEGEQLLRDALRGLQQHFGGIHPQTLTAASDLGTALFKLGRKVEAEAPLRAAWEGRRQLFGEDHLRTLASTHNLGVLLCDLGRPKDAVPLLQAAWEGRRSKLGIAHPRTLASAEKLVSLLNRMRDPQAGLVLRGLWEGFTVHLGSTSPKTVVAARSLAAWLVSWGLEEEAEAVLVRALNAARSAPADEENAGQTDVLRKALLDPGFEVGAWKDLLGAVARRPPAAEMLAADLHALRSSGDPVCSAQESDSEDESEDEHGQAALHASTCSFTSAQDDIKSNNDVDVQLQRSAPEKYCSNIGHYDEENTAVSRIAGQTASSTAGGCQVDLDVIDSSAGDDEQSDNHEPGRAPKRQKLIIAA